jgi:EAL domain-containing protein (putative c-di-GMP-specific phosphodiesterase class I)
MSNPSPRADCRACKDGVAQPFPFSMAFQPIVDVQANRVFAYEALVRGSAEESAGSILSQVTAENRYAFDQSCRVKAISLAAELGLKETGARLSINFMPNAIYSPAACIQLTLKTARKFDFPLDRLIFEITEAEQVMDREHMRNIVTEYRHWGFKVALDDFGAGYCGLSLLADLPTNIIKLDMDLTRNLHQRPAAQAIVSHIVDLARTLGCELVAEGVETQEEFAAIRSCGICLMQGYLLARPGLEALPEFSLPEPSLPAPSVAAYGKSASVVASPQRA